MSNSKMAGIQSNLFEELDDADLMAVVGGSVLSNVGDTVTKPGNDSQPTSSAIELVAVLFLLSVLFTPLFAAVPTFATAPALIMVGFLMISSVQNINWNDPAEAIAAFLILLTMPLTYSIAEALAIGFIIYPLIKVSQGLAHQVSMPVYFLAVISVFQFVLKS
ncbi:solute carrier family 23 protein [Tolypothrix sp. VBCCA 56010]|uniref:solute carrier family 23 protein n=1 Tax=Tolypothrix sp. VBCCA 56010 TaxID=3137731 RepID=UPI003D7D1446